MEWGKKINSSSKAIKRRKEVRIDNKRFKDTHNHWKDRLRRKENKGFQFSAGRHPENSLVGTFLFPFFPLSTRLFTQCSLSQIKFALSATSVNRTTVWTGGSCATTKRPRTGFPKGVCGRVIEEIFAFSFSSTDENEGTASTNLTVGTILLRSVFVLARYELLFVCSLLKGLREEGVKVFSRPHVCRSALKASKARKNLLSSLQPQRPLTQPPSEYSHCTSSLIIIHDSQCRESIVTWSNFDFNSLRVSTIGLGSVRAGLRFVKMFQRRRGLVRRSEANNNGLSFAVFHYVFAQIVGWLAAEEP